MTAAALSLAVLSLSSDPDALALGPQLAVFAAAQGIPTSLVIGPQQDAAATARCAPRALPSPEHRERDGLLRIAAYNEGTSTCRRTPPWSSWSRSWTAGRRRCPTRCGPTPR